MGDAGCFSRHLVRTCAHAPIAVTNLRSWLVLVGDVVWLSDSNELELNTVRIFLDQYVPRYAGPVVILHFGEGQHSGHEGKKLNLKKIEIFCGERVR